MIEGEKLATRLAAKVDGMFDELLKELAASGRYEQAGWIQLRVRGLSEYLRVLDGDFPWDPRSADPARNPKEIITVP